ncbi:hypothetical protein QBC35DRAFT_453663 [Podospora australis]|uniref:Uncharacterized protein n=1 Tax=Podospora australis TaxID=1536484 RepID=A0AAN6WRF8_9PEZI|nr:hypothetical protein QBC35DRAFT_453663 [Podospora australis]
MSGSLPQPAHRSILMTRPTNEFSGLCTALVHQSPILTITAVVAILARFLPIFMANVAYTHQQTHPSFLICARASLVILGIMVAT